MKRKSIAMAMALAMVLSASPVNMAGAAEDDILMEEIVVEEPMEVAEEPAETAGEETTAAVEPEAAEMEEGESAGTAEEEELAADGTMGEVPSNALEGDFIEAMEVVEEKVDDTTDLLAGENSEQDATELEFGKPIQIEAGETVKYQFDGVNHSGYSIFIEKPETVNVYVEYYDYSDQLRKPLEVRDKLETGEIYGTNGEAIYYLTLSNTSETACEVTVYQDSLTCTKYVENINANRGDKVTLSFQATHMEQYFGEIQYEWFERDSRAIDWDSKKIEGATGATYTVETQYSASYYCLMKSKYDYLSSVTFHVNVNSNFEVDSYPEAGKNISPGESALLSVHAASDLGQSAIQYQWYVDDPAEEDMVLIPGATSTTYQTPVLSETAYYACYVTDGCNADYIWFDVYVRDLSAFQNPLVMTEGIISGSIQADGEAIYKFVPTKTARYAIQTVYSDYTGKNFMDESKAELRGEYREEENGYSYLYNLTAGKTYYLQIRNSDNEAVSYQIPVTVDCEHVPGSYITRTEATCTTSGSFKAVCANCKSKYEDVLPATGQHSYGDWSVAQAPTVFADGVQVRTCTVCGAQETAPIAKLAPTMTVNASSIPLKAGQSTTKIKVTDLAAGDSIVSWTSSNPKVVKVNAAGKITAQKKAGGKKATVTVTLASGLTQNITVKVQKSAVKTSKISVETKKLTLEKGAKYSVVPVIAPITTLDKVSYSSSNKKVATVSKKGVITAKKSGKAKITVKSGKKKVTITVTVPKTQPTGITNIPAAKTLKKGKSTTLKAKLAPASAEAKITYKSSNKKVATVNAKGKVTAKKKGTAVITVKAGSIVTTCTITVK